MRTATILFVTLSILYLIGGGVSAFIGKLDTQFYYNSFAIIAGLASILGLIAFVIPKLSKKDIEEVGIEYFKNVVEASDELKKRETELISKEKALSSKERELKELEIKKQEMELLVKKASMNLFLKDQFERKTNRVKEIIDENNELKKSVEELAKLQTRLIALDEEIASDPNVDILNEIITKQSQKEPEVKYVSIVEIFAEQIAKTIKMLIR